MTFSEKEQQQQHRATDGKALFAAVDDGDVDTVRALLRSSPTLASFKDQCGWSLLCVASQKGHADVIVVLLQLSVGDANGDDEVGAVAVDVNTATPEGATPLHLACHSGHSDVVTTLIVTGGAHVNVVDDDGMTPLYIAAQQNHNAIVATLLQHGAEVNAATSEGATPLYIASAQGHVPIVERLLACDGVAINAATRDGATPLYMAASNGHLLAFQRLVSGGADVTAAMRDGGTALHIAAQEGHVVIVQCLVSGGVCNVNAVMRNGTTPLFVAAAKGHLPVVKCLVARGGAKVNAVTSSGATPLAAARHYNHATVVTYLTARGGVVLSDSEVAALHGARGSSACAMCGQQGASQRCGGCGVACYCSKLCQKIHWKPKHKAECTSLKQRRIAQQQQANDKQQAKENE